MITSPSPLGPTPSGNDPAANSRKKSPTLNHRHGLWKISFPDSCFKHNRQFYREVVQRYRAVARDLLRRAWSDDKGQDIAEYAVMLAVILVIVVGTIRLVGSNANTVFSQAASSIQ